MYFLSSKTITLDKKGFSLIELLMVASIIGLLAAIMIASYNVARNKAKVVKAQADLKQLELAIGLLVQDTGMHPNKLRESPCVQNPEVYLNTNAAGIQATDGNFPRWGGPYISEVQTDPWGTNYYFDPDYTCSPATTGCNGLSQVVRVIQSFGPNKAQNYSNSDDIVTVLCVP